MAPPGLIAGGGYLIRGFKLLNRRGIRRFVIIPLGVNILLFAGALWLSISFLGGWLERLQASLLIDAGGFQWLNHLLEWLSWILIPLFVLAFLAVTFYSFSLLANLLAAPFNSLLAARVERHLSGVDQPQASSGNVRDALYDMGTAFVAEGYKLWYFCTRAVVFLVLLVAGYFIPPLGAIVTVLWFIFSAWMLAMEYSDYPMANHVIPFSQQRQILKRNRMFALGFGAATTMATMIPIINFFTMPAAVAAATAMWVDYWRDIKKGADPDNTDFGIV